MSSFITLIATPLGWFMRQIYSMVGNYGWTLVLFTLLMKVIMIPLGIKQKKSMIRMNAFQPLITNIQKKYAKDPERQQQELANLQQKYGYSTTSGCAPLLIQFIILFGLIDVIYKPLKYMAQLSAEVIETLTPVAEGILGSLSRYSPQTSIIGAIQQNPTAFRGLLDADKLDFIKNINLSFLGFNLDAIPSIKSLDKYILVPVLVCVLTYISNLIMNKNNGRSNSNMTGGMTKAMPLYTTALLGFVSFSMPCGVSVYWVFNSLFGILQELVLRLIINPESEKEKIEAQIAEEKERMKAEKKEHAIARKKALKTMASDKYVEDEYETEEEAQIARERLERARARDRERYGEL